MGRIYLRKSLAHSKPLVGLGEFGCWTPTPGICLKACAHLYKNWDLSLAAVSANLTDGPREEAVLWRSRGSSLLGLAYLPPGRIGRTLGQHQIKYQTPCNQFQLEVSSMKKMSILCLVVSYHLIAWALTGVLPFPFIPVC